MMSNWNESLIEQSDIPFMIRLLENPEQFL